VGGWEQNGSYGNGWGVWSGCIWFIIGTGGGLLYYGDQPSGSDVTDLVRYLFSYLISSWGQFQQC
jgi:hypothetical protein